MHATTWMNHEAIMLTEMIQSQTGLDLSHWTEYNFTYMQYLESSNSQRQKTEQWMPGAEGRKE
jgi:hypothetical protein